MLLSLLVHVFVVSYTIQIAVLPENDLLTGINVKTYIPVPILKCGCYSYYTYPAKYIDLITSKKKSGAVLLNL